MIPPTPTNLPTPDAYRWTVAQLAEWATGKPCLFAWPDLRHYSNGPVLHITTRDGVVLMAGDLADGEAGASRRFRTLRLDLAGADEVEAIRRLVDRVNAAADVTDGAA